MIANTLINITVSLAKDVSYKLATKAASSVINKFERKINGQEAIRPGKKFDLFILNEDMDDKIRIVKSLEDSGLLINGATETVKHEIEKVSFLVLRSHLLLLH